jgi:hypothetical protein
MSYVNCPRCGLAVQLRASFLALRHCPRCVAQRGIAVEMLTSDSRTLPASIGRADGRAAPPSIHQARAAVPRHHPVAQGSAVSRG